MHRAPGSRPWIARLCVQALALLTGILPASECSLSAELDERVVVPMDFDWHICDSCLYRIQFFDGIAFVIPGSEDQDAGNIVATLVQLDGSFALGSQLIDVVSMDDIEMGECQYAEPRPDGYLDLLLEFDGRELMDAGERTLRLTGTTWDSEPFDVECCLPDRTGNMAAGTTQSSGTYKPIFADSGGVFPNPFRISTRIAFTLNQPSYVEIRIFDLLGRTVHSLRSSWFGSGEHTVAWDGSDYTGRRLQSGTYFYRMTVEGEAKAGMLVLLD